MAPTGGRSATMRQRALQVAQSVPMRLRVAKARHRLTCCASVKAVMQVVFVSTEVAPYSKTGGLGDVMESLPVALAERGHRTMTVSPMYAHYSGVVDTGLLVPVEVPSARSDAAAQEPPAPPASPHASPSDRAGATVASGSAGPPPAPSSSFDPDRQERDSRAHERIPPHGPGRPATGEGTGNVAQNPAVVEPPASQQRHQEPVTDVTFARFYVREERGVLRVFVEHPLFGPGSGHDGADGGAFSALSGPIYTYGEGLEHLDLQARNSLLCQAALAAPVLLWPDRSDLPAQVRPELNRGLTAMGLSNGIARPPGLDPSTYHSASPWAASSTSSSNRSSSSSGHVGGSEAEHGPLLFVSNDWPTALLPVWLAAYRDMLVLAQTANSMLQDALGALQGGQQQQQQQQQQQRQTEAQLQPAADISALVNEAKEKARTLASSAAAVAQAATELVSWQRPQSPSRTAPAAAAAASATDGTSPALPAPPQEPALPPPPPPAPAAKPARKLSRQHQSAGGHGGWVNAKPSQQLHSERPAHQEQQHQPQQQPEVAAEAQVLQAPAVEVSTHPREGAEQALTQAAAGPPPHSSTEEGDRPVPAPVSPPDATAAASDQSRAAAEAAQPLTPPSAGPQPALTPPEQAALPEPSSPRTSSAQQQALAPLRPLLQPAALPAELLAAALPPLLSNPLGQAPSDGAPPDMAELQLRMQLQYERKQQELLLLQLFYAVQQLQPQALDIGAASALTSPQRSKREGLLGSAWLLDGSGNASMADVDDGSSDVADADDDRDQQQDGMRRSLADFRSFIADRLSNARVVFTVHNFSFQGLFNAATFGRLGLPQRQLPQMLLGQDQQQQQQEQQQQQGSAGSDPTGAAAAAAASDEGATVAPAPSKISWLKAALLASDQLVTVSPNYAQELTSEPTSVNPAPGTPINGTVSKQQQLQGLPAQGANELRGILRERGLAAITNGLDAVSWDPACDALLPPELRYTAADAASGKARAKAALQARLGLELKPRVPLVCFVGRLEEQKGADVLLGALPELLGPAAAGTYNPMLMAAAASRRRSSSGGSGASAEGEGGAAGGGGVVDGAGALPEPVLDLLAMSAAVQATGGAGSAVQSKQAAAAAAASMPMQLAMLGQGQQWVEQAVEQLSSAYPRRAAGVAGFDESLAHLMMAGCDYLIVPSRFEPCGLVALAAQRYGTVPIVAPTGGLLDVVQAGGRGPAPLGYVIPVPMAPSDDPAAMRASQRGLVRALRAAAGDYGSPSFLALRARCMQQDVSWSGPAARWEQLLLQLAAGGDAGDAPAPPSDAEDGADADADADSSADDASRG